MYGTLRIARAYEARALDPSGRLLLCFATGSERGAFLGYRASFRPWKSQRPGGLLAPPFQRIEPTTKRQRKYLAAAAQHPALSMPADLLDILETRTIILGAWAKLGPPPGPAWN